MTPPSRPMVLPPAVAGILATLEASGHEAWVVGGAVRDWLLGRPISDWDLATDARPERIMELLPRAVPTALRHGTVTVPTDDGPVEVTTYRRAGLALGPGGRGDDAWATSLDEDLRARDLTVNAMAWRPRFGGELRDPTGGQADLDLRLLRAVDDPVARLREDPLRALRICRLASRLDFAVEAATAAALPSAVEACAHCAPERLGSEVMGLLGAADPRPGLLIASSTGLLRRILPATGTGPGSALLAALAAEPSPAVRLAALVVGSGGRERAREAAAELLALRLPVRVVRLVEGLVASHPLELPPPDVQSADLRRMVSRLGPGEPVDAHLALAVCLHRADGDDGTRAQSLRSVAAAVSRSGVPLTVADLAVKGEEVCETMGLEPGPSVGRTLNELLDLVLEDPSLNTVEGLREAMGSLVRRPDRWYNRGGRGTTGTSGSRFRGGRER